MLAVYDKPKRISATLSIDNGELWVDIDFILDSGATVNSITYNFIKRNKLLNKLNTNCVWAKNVDINKYIYKDRTQMKIANVT